MALSRYRLTLSIAVAVMAIAVYLIVDMQRAGREQVVTRFGQHQQFQAQQVAHAVETYLEATAHTLLHLARVAGEPGLDRARLEANVNTFSAPTPGRPRTSITAVDERGGILYATNQSAQGVAFATSAVLQWAQKPENRGHVVISSWNRTDPAGAARRANQLFVATPFWQEPASSGQEQWRGVMVVTLDVAALLAERPSLSSAPDEPLRFWIMDQDGTVLLQSDHPEMVHLNIRDADAACLQCHGSFDYVNKMLVARQGTAEYRLAGRPPQLAAFAPVAFANAGWVVVVNTSEEEVVNALRRDLQKMLLVVGLLAAGGSLLAWTLYGNSRERRHAEDDARHWQEKHFLEQSLRLAEEDVSRLHRQNTLILDSVMDGILGLDTEGRHTFVNPAAARMLGYDAVELIGKTSHTMWHHTTKDGHPYAAESCPIYAAYKDGAIHQSGDDVFWRRDGAPLAVEYTSTPIMEQGHLVGAVVTFRDLSDRRQAEAVIREKETYFRTLVENAMDIVSVLNADGTIGYESPAVARVLGYDPSERIGKNALEFVHPDDHQRITSLFQQTALTEGGTATTICRYHHRNGSWRTLESIGRNRLDTPGIHGVVINSRDITESRQLETQLRQAQKMEAIGTLAGGIAHDFNNVLAAILGNAEIILSELEPEHPSHESVQEIVNATRRATDLVSQILTFSRRRESERRTVDLGSIAAEALRLVRATLPATIAIRADIENEPALVLADPTQMYQIVMNLAANAAHAMRDQHGTLTVAVRPLTMDAILASQFTELREGPFIRLSVSDTGHGIDAATRERLFEPFFTTKPQGEGTGLGLAVVHGIVNTHGGAIRVRSDPGQGTCFDLYFPAAEACATEAVNASTAVPRGAGQRILLVDDERAIASVTLRVLTELGYQVDAEVNPEHALERFSSQPDDYYDLVITDLAMPGLNGRELAARVLARRPGQAIIMVTGFSGNLTPEKARTLGLRAVLHKPLDRATLGRAVFEAVMLG